jgi:hypothetical protein
MEMSQRNLLYNYYVRIKTFRKKYRGNEERERERKRVKKGRKREKEKGTKGGREEGKKGGREGERKKKILLCILYCFITNNYKT